MKSRARLLYISFAVCIAAAAEVPELGNLWDRVPPGPHSVGFRMQRSVDWSRIINPVDKGTPLGIAIWYPAAKSPAQREAITQLEYRVLQFSENLNAAAKESLIESEASMMVGWRHIGIVPLTKEQARASLGARGRAIRNAPRLPGRFPVVVLLGGPWYQSTTAEILASHGFLVAAPVRFTDTWTEITNLRFPAWVETDLRDAEWALEELRKEPAANTANITSLGHGSGGMSAMLLAMRNRAISAVINIDAANFSNLSSIDQLIFYHPRLMQVPYLYIATADTRAGADRYADFERMRFSERYEVIVQNPNLRHHDLSNVGRAVSASLRIRGAAQDSILRNYADVQQMVLQFLNDRVSATAGFERWLLELGNAGSEYAVTVREAIKPAPALGQVLARLNEYTPARLEEHYRRDPEAPLFETDQLSAIVAAARTSNETALAAQLAKFALDLHPKSIAIHNLAAGAFESAGDRTAARATAHRCANLELPPNDWRAAMDQFECRDRLNH